jgi:hypothetical protein
MEQYRTPRMTIPTQLVLRALLPDPSKELYGVEIGAAAGLPSGTVHPILARLRHRRAGAAGTPTWWASGAVRSASLPLPSEHRWRCRQEFLAGVAVAHRGCSTRALGDHVWCFACRWCWHGGQWA